MKRNLPAYVYPKGKKGYLYFCRNGTTRMYAAPGTPEFASEYARLLRGIRPVKGNTFNKLIASYKGAYEFRKLAPRTKADYGKVLDYLRDKFGDLDPARMRRKDVVRVRDANADRVKFSRDCIAVLSVLMNHAMDIGWRDDNPAKGVRRLKTPESKRIDRKPWPRDMIEAFRREAPVGSRARLVFELCLGTGQRIGDVLSMKWSDVTPEGIHIRQGKTGRALTVPLTGDLRHVLSETPKEGLTIVTGQQGRPASYRAAHDGIMKVRRAIGAEAYDIHALRYSTVAELAALECSDDLIMAVTGHSSRSMVAHYGGEVRQLARARQAQKRRDD